MVVTRRISANPAADESPSIQPPTSPAPAPVSREMRRLFIDANPSLGGQASLEQVIPKKRKSVAFVDLVQDDTGVSGRVSHAEEKGSQQQDGYWFMPEGAGSTDTSTVSSSPPSEDPTQRSGGTRSFAVRDELDGAADAPITIRSQSPTGLTEHEAEPSSRPTKVSRELKRLRIDANPSLSFVDLESPEPSSSTRSKSKEPVHSLREVPNTRETRAGNSSLDRLEYDVSVVRKVGHKASLEDILTERAAETRPHYQRLRDRPVPSSSKPAPKPPRRRKKNPHPKKWPEPAKEFPDPCPEELADQILRIFGEAAGEAPLLRALEGTAQDSIARELRHEAPADYAARAKREISCLESFDPKNGLTWDEHFLAHMAKLVPPSKEEIKAEESRKRAERAERRSSMKRPTVTASAITNAQRDSTDDMMQTTVLDGAGAEERAWQSFMERLSSEQRDYFEWYMSLPVMTEEEETAFKEQNAEADRIAEEQRLVELRMAGDPEWERQQAEKRKKIQEEEAAFEVVFQDALQEKMQRLEQQRVEEQLQEELLQEDRRRDKGKGRAM